MPFHWFLDITNPNENQDPFSLSMKKVDYPMPLSLSHYPIFMEDTKSCKIIANHWAKESQGQHLVLTSRLPMKGRLKVKACNL